MKGLTSALYYYYYYYNHPLATLPFQDFSFSHSDAFTLRESIRQLSIFMEKHRIVGSLPNLKISNEHLNY